MADEKTPPGGGSKPKTKARNYTVLGAIGEKDAAIESLDFRVIAEVQATTTTAAKAAVLERNPEFPRANPLKDGEGEERPAVDLKSLVDGRRLWLHAESGFKPKPVGVKQPPPVYEGL
jgi:hypothetical protein